MNHSESEPLPIEAREHLQASGDKLLCQLEALREQENQRVEIEPLDADAELALRRSGDQLLASLDASRQGLTTPTRKRRFAWGAIAACLTGAVTCAWLFNGPSESQNFAAQKTQKRARTVKKITPEPEIEAEAGFPVPMATVPEPSTGLLALAGTMLFFRRRRD